MDNFRKNDTNKNRLELIEPCFIEGLGAVLTFGADKYMAFNWQKAGSPEDLLRIKGALMRHELAYAKGEKVDPETGLSHLYHMACNLMFLDYFDRMDAEITASIDTVPTKDPSDIDSIIRWLENSDFSFRNIDEEGDFIFNNHNTNTQFAMQNYNQFFAWLVRHHPEVYIRNGGSRAYADKVADES